MDVVDVVMGVTHGQVLPGLEEEIPAAQAEHHRAGDARGPDDRTSEDLAQVVEDAQATVVSTTPVYPSGPSARP